MDAGRSSAAVEGFVRVDDAQLFYRDIGSGPAIVVIHGGPDFDHTYLLPDLDRLADAYRLIYYDQRGRGRSQGPLRLAEIGIARYLDDLDALRRHFDFDAVVVLGHSWGGHVAMHYAVRHPRRVSHLVLLNSAPATHDDYLAMCAERQRQNAPRQSELDALESSPAFEDGDPDTVAAYYRIDFSSAFPDPALAARLHVTWRSRRDLLRGRAIEERLMSGLYWAEGYTLVPDLRQLTMPALIVHGAHDFVPLASSRRIADAIPGARLVLLEHSGHFSYIDAPRELRAALDAFLADA